HGQHVSQAAAENETLPLFDEVGSDENDRRPKSGSQRRHFQRIEVGVPTRLIEFAKVVVPQAERKVVGPVGDEGGPNRHSDNGDYQLADHEYVNTELYVTVMCLTT